MRNPNLHLLNTPYLFGAVTQQVQAHPNLVDLGVGDTSLPLVECVVQAIKQAAATSLKYGPEHGSPLLKEAIVSRFYPMLSADEIFISDGAKTDIGRIWSLFDPQITIALQDPTYPTYRESAIVSGKTRFVYLPCLPENQFFPESLPQADVFVICSPNNPTGYALNRKQLQQLIEHAHKNQSLIIYDAAYSNFISDPTIPRTLYELDGANQVVIEINSFSKLAGFTGLRLSWSVVPKMLQYPEGGCIHSDWSRIISSYYNGTSRAIQAAGLAVLSDVGMQAIHQQIKIYQGRADRLKQALLPIFGTIYGADHAPYLWIPTDKSLFDNLGIITIDGKGFGPSGQGFVRLSAFGPDTTIDEAIFRCSQLTTQLST